MSPQHSLKVRRVPGYTHVGGKVQGRSRGQGIRAEGRGKVGRDRLHYEKVIGY